MTFKPLLQYMKPFLVGLVILVILMLLYTTYDQSILGATTLHISQTPSRSALRVDSTNSTGLVTYESPSSVDNPSNSSEMSNLSDQLSAVQRILTTTMSWKKWTPSSNVSKALQQIYENMYEYAEVADSEFFLEVEATKRQPCAIIPPNMVGRIKVYQDYFPISELSSLNFYVKPGGSHQPSHCRPRSSVAIIIPFRNREHHLSILLLNLHPFLQKQEKDYTIFVVNQVPGSKFNRALLMNIGFWEAMKIRKFDCIIFHDVDLIPENDKNFYECSEDNPRHMSVAIDKFNYQLPYKDILGGIVAIRWDMFMNCNGYSNVFFGWGGEDDDFSQRVRSKNYIIVRYPTEIAKYQMIKHESDAGNEANSKRFEMLKNVQTRMDHDGLNSLTYKLKSVQFLPLYTRINVDINQTEVMNAEPYSLADFPYTSDRWKPS